MKSLSMLMIAVSMLTANIAAADEHADTNRLSTSAHAVRIASARPAYASGSAKPAKVSCEDLMTFDQASRPQNIYFSQGRIGCKLRGR